MIFIGSYMLNVPFPFMCDGVTTWMSVMDIGAFWATSMCWSFFSPVDHECELSAPAIFLGANCDVAPVRFE
ncbi:hypothetical protein DND58_25885 [Pseudomonas syringae pv. pisi]|uniref:Uncharacterized protein n=1 Tax=Pseudomonas syringae pv. pisi str. 1704B TaxID=629263 RepID=F3GBS7_PSESJ|nr:hypothetical protein PSYPI_19943 [Pseudomonas syringae pv. pisi str. 1704B]PYD17822.1 hypothetical protein DND62_00015 [Pseudomonas syringae pv. pisi]PYD25420.1 hypothetical protein DND58_25885 [Pseudomonas syringae pv. pisi]PYD35516.1 hypothetical protein DND67_06260 [Pseudomonas syringae pv. pisi]